MLGEATKAGYKLGWHLLHAPAKQFEAQPEKQVRLQHHKKNSDACALYTKASFDEWGSYADNGVVREGPQSRPPHIRLHATPV